MTAQRLFLFLTVLPYVSFVYKFPTDVQPWAALVAWIMLVTLFLSGKKLVIRGLDSAIFALFLVVIFYNTQYSADEIMIWLRKSVVFLLSFGIFIYARSIHVVNLRLALLVAVIIYLIFALMQYISVGLYEAVSSILINIKHVQVGERGASSLAPESTDFGFTMVFFVLLAVIAKKVDRMPAHVLGIDIYWTIIVLASANIVLSRSASGIIGLFVVLAIIACTKLLSVRQMILGLGGLVGAFALFLLLPADVIEEVRGLRLLNQTIRDPAGLLQTSFAHRAIHNWVGLIALIESFGLGYGAGSFTDVAPDIYLNHNLAFAANLTRWHTVAVFETLHTNALSVFSLLMVEHGVLGLTLALLVFAVVWRSDIPHRFAVLALMFMTWGQSFPAAYPLFWLLVGLADNPMFRDLPWRDGYWARPFHPLYGPQGPPLGQPGGAPPPPLGPNGERPPPFPPGEMTPHHPPGRPLRPNQRGGPPNFPVAGRPNGLPPRSG